MEVQVFSKLWYLAQILPLSQALAVRVIDLGSSFLWVGYLERLPWQELHHWREAGYLGVSCVFSRGQALISKHLCHQLAAGGSPAAHLAFWLEHVVGHNIPCLAVGAQMLNIPAPLAQAGKVFVEIFSHSNVPPNGLRQARAATIYACLLHGLSPPPPKVEARGPVSKDRVWRRLWGSGLHPHMVDCYFMLIHNIFQLRGCLASLGIVPGGA